MNTQEDNKEKKLVKNNNLTVDSSTKIDIRYKNKEERDIIDKIKFDCGME